MTTDDDKLDLSALDPTRDTLRFERMVRALSAKAVEQRRRLDPLGQATRWWRPAMALAAGLALFLWVPSLLRATAGGQAATHEPGTTLLTWASGDGPASAAEMLELFGRTP